MEDYQRNLFDGLLREAAGNLAERVIHRAGGPGPAAEVLRTDPDAAGRAEFVAACFDENLLNTVDGYCFVLACLPRRALPADPGGSAEEVLQRLAKAAFADVVTVHAVQLIDQQRIFT